jgi:hypothetical protein
MIHDTQDSGCYLKVTPQTDYIDALLQKICIIWANGDSFCARLIAILDGRELWFEAKNGQKIMIRRSSVSGIRPLQRPEGRD